MGDAEKMEGGQGGGKRGRRLVNERGQWDGGDALGEKGKGGAWGLLEVVWPKPGGYLSLPCDGDRGGNVCARGIGERMLADEAWCWVGRFTDIGVGPLDASPCVRDQEIYQLPWHPC